MIRSAVARSPLGSLVWTLVRTDFKTRYHGTLGGFVWSLLKPLAMFGVLLGIFSWIFATSPDYNLDLIIGLFLWDVFQEGTKAGLASLHAKGFLLTKTRLPPAVVVVTSVANSAISLAVFSVIIAVYLGIAGRLPSGAGFALFLLYGLCLLLVVVGFSLAASVLFLRYRDLNQVWEMVLQAGFFVAPIIYPLSILPERFHLWLYLWPPTPIVEFSRQVLVDGTVPTAKGHLLLGLLTAASLAVGSIVYSRLSSRALELL